jgi:hypothetical protein
VIDLADAAARKVVVDDLLKLARHADEIAPASSIIGVHLDNVHKLDARGLADVFNEFLKSVKAAQDRGLISKARKIGYVAKNNPQAFREALKQSWLDAPPLYQIKRTHDWTGTGCLILNRVSPRRSENDAGSQSS